MMVWHLVSGSTGRPTPETAAGPAARDCRPCGMRRGYDSHSPQQRHFRTSRANSDAKALQAGRSRRDSMTNGNGAPPEAALPPQLNVLAQYTKDLSFENPNAPASLAPQPQQPSINIQINVSANNIAENEFEVILLVEGKAEHE